MALSNLVLRSGVGPASSPSYLVTHGIGNFGGGPPPTNPVVTSVSPNSGNITGGTAVTITGLRFTGITGVTFGGVSTSFSFVSDTSVNTTSPAHAVGVTDVIITTAAGSSPVSSLDHFTYVNPGIPSVSSVLPNNGPTTGGTSVTISGSLFTGVSDVSFGGVAATSFLFVNDTTITAVAPAGSGTVDVIVTATAGVSSPSVSDQYTYTSPIVAAETIANAPGGQLSLATGVEKFPIDASTGNPSTDGKYITTATIATYMLNNLFTALQDFADDTAAAAGGVLVGHVYKTGSIIKVRVS